MTEMDTLAARLRKARNDAALTLEDVAARLGVSSYSVVSRYESGSKSGREPDASTLARLADIYGVTVDELLGRSPEPRRELSPAPVAASPNATDMPAWVDRLEASVTEVSRETSAAILDQKIGFIGEMVRIGEQMEKRDAQNSALLQGLQETMHHLGGIIAGNTATTASNTEVMARAVQIMEAQAATVEAQAATIARLEARLLDEADPPPVNPMRSDPLPGVNEWRSRSKGGTFIAEGSTGSGGA